MHQATGNPMEVELKLLVDAQYQNAILNHPLLGAANGDRPREQVQVDTYFDTPDLKLRKRHIGLRIRRAKGRWVQNIKGDGQADGGLHSRAEWERPVAGPVPELDHLDTLIDDKAVRRGLDDAPALERRLAPVFATNVKRTAWDVQLQDGGHVECALDRGTLECGAQKIPISELELELKGGDVRQLYDLALALQQHIPVQLGNQSKADRGYALLSAQPQGAVKASRPALSRGMSTEQAFVAIAANCLAHIQGNRQGVAGAQDGESLHQMRVGMRRLRSALGMFKKLITLDAELQTELDWLAGELGEARDWDVLSAATLPALVEQGAAAAPVDGVRQAAAEAAQAHRQRSAVAVDSPRYTHLMLALSRWIHTAGWREGLAGDMRSGDGQPDNTQPGDARPGNTPSGDARPGNTQSGKAKHGDSARASKLARPVEKFARKVLRRDHRRLRRRARNLAAATPAMRHRLRIAAKKSRYATEFFSALFSAKTVRPYVKRLTGLQDELGLLNDYAVAEQLLTGLAEERPEIDAGAGYVKGFLAARTESEHPQVLRLWKRFAPLPRPG